MSDPNQMTPITSRDLPDGMTLDFDNTTWNIGHAYRWSEIYQSYMWHGTLTVKPGQSLVEAWDHRYDEPMWPDYEVFFSIVE
jgi:hypothetical protein|tara:strand:+ start:619 stop:864 length:246 start_codon:yes stop_codon:yes gene_type:complete